MIEGSRGRCECISWRYTAGKGACPLQSQAVDCPASGGQYAAFSLFPGCLSECCSCPTPVQATAQEGVSLSSHGQTQQEAPHGGGAGGANFRLRILLRPSAAALCSQGTLEPGIRGDLEAEEPALQLCAHGLLRIPRALGCAFGRDA